MRSLVAAALVASFAWSVGCGGSAEADAEDVVKTYLQAVADGDGKKACDQLTGEAKRAALEYVATNLPELSATSCDDAVTELAKNIGGDERAALADVEISEVTITGDSAVVSAEGATSDAELEKTGDRWYISGGLFE